MIKHLENAFEGNSDLGAAYEGFFHLFHIDLPSSIDVNKHNFVFKGTSDTEGIDELHFRLGIVRHPDTRIFIAPVARTYDHLHVLFEHGSKGFGEHKIPTNDQTDSTKLSIEDRYCFARSDVAALRKPEVDLAILAENISVFIDVIRSVVQAHAIAFDDSAGDDINGVANGKLLEVLYIAFFAVGKGFIA